LSQGLKRGDQGARVELSAPLIRLSSFIGETITIASQVASYLATGEYETGNPYMRLCTACMGQ
jgi:hypothetical protein